MKLLPALALLALAACSKTSDVGPIRDGVNQLVARATPELDEAAKHLSDLGGKIPPAAVAAVNDATSLIGNTRTEIAAAKQALDEAEKKGAPEEMEKVSDGLSEKLERARTQITVDIDQIDALVYADANWPKPVVAQVAPPEPTPAPAEPTPESPTPPPTR
ncbi:MAG TPA: hypothetical protein VGM88_22695 [Kofleriaceae bacterium]